MAELDPCPVLDVILTLGSSETLEGDVWDDLQHRPADLTGLSMRLDVAGGPTLPVEIYDAPGGLWRVQIEATHTAVQTTTSHVLWLIDGAGRPFAVLRGGWRVV